MGLTGNIYRVVVADDEPVAVKAICHIIEMNCPQFQVVGTAENGEKALKVIEETEPDLVLTDIAMPLMSGLELAHQAGSRMPDLCFVIISGYQDFEYMRDAIRNGVLDYLTKPIVPSQMLPTMKNVEEKLNTFYYNRRNALLRKICLGEDVSQKEISKFFPHKEFYAALLRENGLPRRYSPGKEPELYGTIEEAFSVYGRDNMEELFLIPREILDGQSLVSYMKKVELRQKTEGSYTTLLYYSRAFSASEISTKIRELFYWLNNLSTVGYSQAVDLDKKKMLEGRLPSPDTTELSGLITEMEQYVKAGKYDRMQKCIEIAFEKWGSERRPQVWMEHSARRILNFIRTYTEDEESLIESEYQLEDIFYYATSMEILIQNLQNLFGRFGQKEKEKPKADSPEFFENVEKYLRGHLYEPPSLQELSDIFAISQAYMSKLFRKYTGQTYNQYLTGIRMERAKQLMKENNELYVKDIAEMVGYHDQFYFSRIFRSHTGKSPADYLNQ
ncbi:MAG: response regulator [Eubacteriales bacterium]|nr:response regulator [Eubacteriales bacterium]